jgi:hypothetical protein
MNTKTKLLTGAIALVLSTSTVLTASNASARPYDDDQYNGQYNTHNYGTVWSQHDQDARDRYDRRNDREFRLNNRDDYRYNNRRNVYIYRPSQRYRNNYDPRVVRLPDGCRRVVYRNQVYYTPNNYDFYTYDSGRRGFIVVNFPGVRIGF